MQVSLFVLSMAEAQQFEIIEDQNVVVEEHCLAVNGRQLKERKEMATDEDVTFVMHTRWIDERMYEVIEKRKGHEVIERKVKKSKLHGDDQIRHSSKKGQDVATIIHSGGN